MSVPSNPAVVPASFIPGMTLRDWFAGQALAGLLADPDFNIKPPACAQMVYDLADALIDHRGEGEGE